MQQRTRETFCKAYHFDRMQWNYKCRAYTRKICTLYGIYFKRIATIPNRFSGDLQDIWTSNIFQRWNRKFFFAMRKPWPFSLTFLTNIFSKIIFVCCGKDIHHVVMLIEISVRIRTQSQIIPENHFKEHILSQSFWSYLSVHLSYGWHDFWEKN